MPWSASQVRRRTHNIHTHTHVDRVSCAVALRAPLLAACVHGAILFAQLVSFRRQMDQRLCRCGREPADVSRRGRQRRRYVAAQSYYGSISHFAHMYCTTAAIAKAIRDAGMRAGVAVKPKTDGKGSFVCGAVHNKKSACFSQPTKSGAQQMFMLCATPDWWIWCLL